MSPALAIVEGERGDFFVQAGAGLYRIMEDGTIGSDPAATEGFTRLLADLMGPDEPASGGAPAAD